MKSLRNKNLGRMLCMMLIAMVGLLAVATPALAKQYKVRIFGGNNGTYADKDPYETMWDAGEYFYPDTDAVEIKDNKYYAKGFRLSGADKMSSEYYIIEDTDIVVAYGVRGKMVNYTLHFVEYNNPSNVLAQPRTFEGKVGDIPVAAYEYIPGWRPIYRQITGTLVDGDNDWTFEYVRVEEGEENPTTTPGTTETTTTTTPGTTETTTTTGTAPGTTTTTATATATATGTATGTDAAIPATPGGGEGTEGGDGTPETQELLNLDNPLSSGDETGNGTGNGTGHGTGFIGDMGLPSLTIGLITIAILVLVILILFFIRRKTAKDDDEDEEGLKKDTE